MTFRSLILTLGVLIAGSLPASALPFTVCTGSWDGPGQTSCELLGSPGVIGTIGGFDFTQYETPEFLFGITAYDYSNTFDVLSDGSLRYQPRSEVPLTFFSPTHAVQFAVWEDEQSVIVGIEDLQAGDWDYNDHVVRFAVKGHPVPEGMNTLTGLVVGLGIVALMRLRSRT